MCHSSASAANSIRMSACFVAFELAALVSVSSVTVAPVVGSPRHPLGRLSYQRCQFCAGAVGSDEVGDI